MKKFLSKLSRIYLINFLIILIVLPVLVTGATSATLPFIPSILPVTITSTPSALPQISEGGLVPCEGLACTVCDLLVLVQNVINFVLQLAFWICIVIIIVGAFMWMLSFGNQKNITAGQKLITNAIIGLAIVLLAWVIVHTFFWFIKEIGGFNMTGSWWHLECY
ncbi:MAG: hypothetical protein BWY48_00070 [Parcubacteria group bacterium ADurb.Bin305]|nr:MAG: hypothetical protein BWY48_00070 [Parcubacteria group bacterium ADurb.Bin305]